MRGGAASSVLCVYETKRKGVWCKGDFTAGVVYRYRRMNIFYFNEDH